MYKDSGKQAMYYKQYRETHRQHKREYDRTRGSIHRRVYTEGGGEWKCFKCGATMDNNQLDIHHKDFNHNNNDLTNLVCLCKECHRIVHDTWRNTIGELIISGTVEWDGTKHE